VVPFSPLKPCDQQQSRSTRETSEWQLPWLDTGFKLLLYKETLQTDRFRELVQQLQSKLTAEQIVRQRLVVSYEREGRRAG
jgi:hypothetical protein